jgi:hypothetical protein
MRRRSANRCPVDLEQTTAHMPAGSVKTRDVLSPKPAADDIGSVGKPDRSSGKSSPRTALAE